jgi:hypothetical protein
MSNECWTGTGTETFNYPSGFGGAGNVAASEFAPQFRWSSVGPNNSLQETLRKIRQRLDKMPMSSGSDTLDIIREARDGGMYGFPADR